jgi:succinate-semialdehyde dehydrogenase/glutarate-semialdehyde dehydrogenase
MISGRLIPSPHIRKITFTGSTAVGKLLAGMAGQHMKRATMELGGHAPVIVTKTADVTLAVRVLSAAKFRNAGQVCISPTRFLIQEDIYDQFAEAFTVAAGAIVVGPGLADGVQMGPLANERRLHAMQTLVADAIDQGARLATGGRRFGETGFFYEPTVLDRVPATARVMNEEPFGPIATLAPFRTLAEAIAEANRLPYALASYAYTSSLAEAQTLTHAIEAGMVSINGAALALPETPNGGLKDSGYGAEGGTEGIDPYLITKFATYA